MAAIMIPTPIDIMIDMKTENLAAWGRPAPSSLETRTLHTDFLK